MYLNLFGAGILLGLVGGFCLLYGCDLTTSPSHPICYRQFHAENVVVVAYGTVRTPDGKLATQLLSGFPSDPPGTYMCRQEVCVGSASYEASLACAQALYPLNTTLAVRMPGCESVDKDKTTAQVGLGFAAGAAAVFVFTAALLVVDILCERFRCVCCVQPLGRAEAL